PSIRAGHAAVRVPTETLGGVRGVGVLLNPLLNFGGQGDDSGRNRHRPYLPVERLVNHARFRIFMKAVVEHTTNNSEILPFFDKRERNAAVIYSEGTPISPTWHHEPIVNMLQNFLEHCASHLLMRRLLLR